MQECTLVIGGRGMRLVGEGSLPLVMSVPGMAQFEVPGAQVDMTVWLDTPIHRPACNLCHTFKAINDQMECRFGIDAEGVYYYVLGHVGALRFDARCPKEVQITPIRNNAVARFMLWNAYSMMGLWQGVVPVHSSTVVKEGRAVLCLGESGTGKSTHTRLWMENIPGSELLNDDSPIVTIDEGVPTVYGSPWSGKTDCFRTDRYPIAALLRLEQKPDNSIRRLPILEAFAALHPSCPPSHSHESRCLDRVTDFVGEVVSRTPVFRLGCLPNREAALLSYKTIFNA